MMSGTVSLHSQELFVGLLASRYGCGLHRHSDGTYCLVGNTLVADLAGGHLSLVEIAELLIPDFDFNPQAIEPEECGG